MKTMESEKHKKQSMCKQRQNIMKSASPELKKQKSKDDPLSKHETGYPSKLFR